MIDFVTNLVLSHHYAAMFGILFVSAMGVPIPEEPVLLAGGLAVGWGHASLGLTVAACALGVLAGDVYIYFLGRLWGDGFLRTALGRFVFPASRHNRIRKLYARHGSKTVFLGRFIPAVRFGVFFFAGQLRMPLPRFVALNTAGAALNIPAVVLIGMLAASKFLDQETARTFAAQTLGTFHFWFFLALAVGVAAVIWRAVSVPGTADSGEA